MYLASKFFSKECEPKLRETNEREDVPTNGDDDNDGIDISVAATESERSDVKVAVSSAEEDFLSNHAVCMCDDDNDLEMALACQHAYLPDIASESMRETIAKFPDHFTTTFRIDADSESEKEDSESVSVEETDASDLALSIIWERTHREPDTTPVKRARISPPKLSVALCFVAIFLVLM